MKKSIVLKKKQESIKRLQLSPAMKQVVKAYLKEEEKQSDTEFLMRIRMERKLSSL